jgi:VWFA-related protein
MMKHCLSLLLVALIGSNLAAQQPVSPPPVPQSTPQKIDAADVVKITSNLVQVDAVVTDKNGKVVTDLKADEVQIFENGKPQKITHFSYNPTGAATGNETPKPVATDKVDPVTPPVMPTPVTRGDVRRTIALVVDDLGLSFESIAFTRRALKKFVEEQMQPGDLVAIIRTGGGVGALQQFTSDKRLLHAAIEGVKYNLMGRADASAFAAIRPPQLQIPDEQASRNQTAEAFREEVFSVGTLGAISYVVRGLHDMPGRKSVLLVSDGLQIFSPGDPNRTNRVQAALDSLVDLANRASVVIYTMDARGLPTIGLQAQDNPQASRPVGRNPGLGGPTGVSREGGFRAIDALMATRRETFNESQNGLNYLADQTGGLPIRNTNDLSGGIQRVLDDQRGYYLIGYRPDEKTFDAQTGRGKFHDLSLKVTRSGKFNVRMRNGFYGISDEEIKPKQKTATQQLLNAITSPFGSTGIHVQLTSLFGNDLANGSFMTSMLHIDARDLTFKDGPNGTHLAVFDVLAVTFGSNGVPVDHIGRTFTLEFPEDLYQRTLRQGLVYNLRVPVKKAGAYQFRVSLRDTASDRLGSASQFIEVPDLARNRLELSGVALSGRVMGSSATGQGASPGEGAQESSPEASPAVRRFRHGMLLEFGFLIYNARLDKASGKPQLVTHMRLFRDGKQVFSGGERPFDPKSQPDLTRLLVAGGLELGTDLAPGEYVLQVIVTDLLADKKYRTATQWMDFEIVK